MIVTSRVLGTLHPCGMPLWPLPFVFSGLEFPYRWSRNLGWGEEKVLLIHEALWGALSRLLFARAEGIMAGEVWANSTA